MQLTPLRFTRAHYTEPPQPAYGASSYQTNCGRFCIRKSHGNWYIHQSSNPDYDWIVWLEWSQAIGLDDTPFSTRGEALQALQYALEASGLMDAQVPT